MNISSAISNFKMIKLITSKTRLNRQIHHFKIKEVEANNKIEELGFKLHKSTLDLEYSSGRNLELMFKLVSNQLLLLIVYIKSQKLKNV